MLAYICIHTHTNCYRRESDVDRRIHIHTHAHPWFYMCVNAYLGARCLWHLQERFHFTHTQTHLDTHRHTHTHSLTSSCLLEIWLMMTHTPMPIPRFDCLHKHIFLFTQLGEFPLHATSVWRVFLVETTILQNVLRNIRAWSANFLVTHCNILFLTPLLRYTWGLSWRPLMSKSRRVLRWWERALPPMRLAHKTHASTSI